MKIMGGSKRGWKRSAFILYLRGLSKGAYDRAREAWEERIGEREL
jgi:hypothetical protein